MMIVVLFALLGLGSGSQSCSTDFDCHSVTTALIWTSCVSGVCTCSKGASGSATTADKCTCVLGNILLQEGIYCLNVSATLAAQAKCTIQKANFRELYRRVVFPNNIPYILGTASPLDIIHPTIKARVNPLGDYDEEGIIEYFYGLASSPYGYAGRVVLRDMRCEGNTVWGRTDIFLNFSSSPIAHLAIGNLTHETYAKFSDDNRITYLDVTFPNLGFFADVAPTEVFEAAPGYFLPKRVILIQGICGLIQSYCTGTNQQYTDLNDCVQYHSSLEWGTWYHAYANSTVCHQLHAQLVGYRPVVHCPHTGRNGGVTGNYACVDFQYSDYYKKDLVEGATGYDIIGTSPLSAGGTFNKRDAIIGPNGGVMVNGTEVLFLENFGVQWAKSQARNARRHR